MSVGPIALIAVSSLLGVNLGGEDGTGASVDALGVGVDASLDEGVHLGVDAAGVAVDADVATEGVALDLDGTAADPGPDATGGAGTADPGPASGGKGGILGRVADVPAPEAVAVAAPTAVLAAAAAVAAYRASLWGRAGIRLLQIGAAVVPFFWLFSRIDEGDLAKNPVRKAVLEYVRARPGVSIKEVQETQQIAWGTAVYHLHRLEQGGYLVSEKTGRMHRYWERNTPEARTRLAAAVLMDKTPRDLADAVQAQPGIRQKTLCEALGISKPVASKYLQRLEKEALVEVRPAGNAKQYYPGPGLRGLQADPGLDVAALGRRPVDVATGA